MGTGSPSKTSGTSNIKHPIDSSVSCEPCLKQGRGSARVSVSYCVQCSQFCCQVCAENHRKFKGTQTHQHAIFVTAGRHRRLNTQNFPCDRCNKTSKLHKNDASTVCFVCKQLMCKDCDVIHDNEDTFKTHRKLTLAAHARDPVSGSTDFRGREDKPAIKTDRKRQLTRDCRNEGTFGNNPSVDGSLTFSKNYQPIAASYCGEFSVSTASDKHIANVYDVSTMLDGKIVIIDDRNSKMKIFTPDHKLYSSLSFAYLPGNVTCINENMIAMAMSNEILYFKLKGTNLSQMSHRLPLKGDITGIVKNVNTLAVTYLVYGKQSRIGVINSKGIEKEINRTERNSSVPMEIWGRTAVLENSRDSTVNVVVMEDDAGTVGCYNIRGHRAWTCLIPQAGSWQGGLSTKMGGIAVVGNVALVTDVINHVIHVVTERGEYGGILLDQTDTLHKPYAICYNIKRRLLYVTKFRSDIVKVFNIK